MNIPELLKKAEKAGAAARTNGQLGTCSQDKTGMKLMREAQKHDAQTVASVAVSWRHGYRGATSCTK